MATRFLVISCTVGEAKEVITGLRARLNETTAANIVLVDAEMECELPTLDPPPDILQYELEPYHDRPAPLEPLYDKKRTCPTMRERVSKKRRFN